MARVSPDRGGLGGGLLGILQSTWGWAQHSGLRTMRWGQSPKNIFRIDLDISPISSIFQGSTLHSLRVLTRPLADVSAPKHTAILARFHFVICGLFYFYQPFKLKC